MLSSPTCERLPAGRRVGHLARYPLCRKTRTDFAIYRRSGECSPTPRRSVCSPAHLPPQERSWLAEPAGPGCSALSTTSPARLALHSSGQLAWQLACVESSVSRGFNATAVNRWRYFGDTTLAASNAPSHAGLPEGHGDRASPDQPGTPSTCAPKARRLSRQDYRAAIGAARGAARGSGPARWRRSSQARSCREDAPGPCPGRR